MLRFGETKKQEKNFMVKKKKKKKKKWNVDVGLRLKI